jgi:hypothetical protein
LFLLKALRERVSECKSIRMRSEAYKYKLGLIPPYTLFLMNGEQLIFSEIMGTMVCLFPIDHPSKAFNPPCEPDFKQFYENEPCHN